MFHFAHGRREPSRFNAKLLAACIPVAFLLFSASAWANQFNCAQPPGQLIAISCTGGQSIPEGPATTLVSFTVKNNSGMNLILDYAFASIAHGGPDPTDLIHFSGLNGSGGLPGGLGSVPLFLPIGGMGVFTYSVTSPPEIDDNPSDFGINPVTFSVEYSPGTLVGVPVFIPGGNGALVFVANSNSGAINPAVLAQLLNFVNNPPGCAMNFQPPCQPDPPLLLYANGITAGPVSTSVDVFDIPEPSTLLLGATGLLGLLGRARRRIIT